MAFIPPCPQEMKQLTLFIWNCKGQQTGKIILKNNKEDSRTPTSNLIESYGK